jgi:GNAT superfamily N-acetyltransferase
VIRPISYVVILDNKDLLREYGEECSIPEIGLIDPQPDLYASMEKSGLMQDFGAFHEERLVGFASVLTYIVPHYGRKIATVESIFVSRNYRKTGIGRELMRTVNLWAKGQACKVILYSAPAESQLEKLLSLDRAYRRTNAVFCRELC